MSDADEKSEFETKLAEALARVEALEKDLAAEKESSAKWKDHAKTWEDRSKENFEKAKRLDEIEEQNKTELEKAVARAEAAEKAVAEREAAEQQREAESAAKAELEKARDEVFKGKKLDERGLKVSILRGSTREELEQHAAELAEALPFGSGSGSGGDGDDFDKGEMTPDDIVATVTAR